MHSEAAREQWENDPKPSVNRRLICGSTLYIKTPHFMDVIDGVGDE